MHTKYEVCISYSSKVIAKVKVFLPDRQTDKKTYPHVNTLVKPVFSGTHMAPAKAKHDRRMDGTDIQNDPYVGLCFAGATKMRFYTIIIHKGNIICLDCKLPIFTTKLFPLTNFGFLMKILVVPNAYSSSGISWFCRIFCTPSRASPRQWGHVSGASILYRYRNRGYTCRKA